MLGAAVGEAVKPLGFRRRGGSWYRLAGELYSVISIQRSRWGESCYVNMGFSTVRHVDKGWLPESMCQVRFRVDALDSVSPEDLRLLEGDAAERMTEERLRGAPFERIALPASRVLAAAADLGGLREVLATDVGRQVFMHKEMAALLKHPGKPVGQ